MDQRHLVNKAIEFILSAFICVEFTLEQSKGSLRESADYSFLSL